MSVEGEDITRKAVWRVSSVATSYNSKAENLFDGNKNTFWESEGKGPPHYIIAQFPKKTRISTLQIYLTGQDTNYSPQLLVISVGNDPSELREIARVEYPPAIKSSWRTIEVHEYTCCLQITILANQNLGKNTRIRLIRVFGPPKTYGFLGEEEFHSPMISQFAGLR